MRVSAVMYLNQPSACTKPDDSLQFSDKTNTHVGLQNRSMALAFIIYRVSR